MMSNAQQIQVCPGCNQCLLDEKGNCALCSLRIEYAKMEEDNRVMAEALHRVRSILPDL